MYVLANHKLSTIENCINFNNYWFIEPNVRAPLLRGTVQWCVCTSLVLARSVALLGFYDVRVAAVEIAAEVATAAAAAAAAAH